MRRLGVCETSSAADALRVPETFRLERDPKDERYINLAVASASIS